MAESWVKIETRFGGSPKWDIVPPQRRALAQAMLLHLICGAYEHLTDGYVNSTLMRRSAQLTGLVRVPMRTVNDLVRAGFLEPDGDGYVIHDYLEVQESKERAEERKRLNRERQERSRQSKKDPKVTRDSNALGNALVTRGRNAVSRAEQSKEQQQRARAALPHEVGLAAAVAAAELTDEALQDLASDLEAAGWRRQQLDAARRKPDLARAWLDYAEAVATTNPGAYAWSGFQSGQKPPNSSNGTSGRPPLAKQLDTWMRNVGWNYHDWSTCEDEIAEYEQRAGQTLQPEDREQLKQLWEQLRAQEPA